MANRGPTVQSIAVKFIQNIILSRVCSENQVSGVVAALPTQTDRWMVETVELTVSTTGIE